MVFVLSDTGGLTTVGMFIFSVKIILLAGRYEKKI